MADMFDRYIRNVLVLRPGQFHHGQGNFDALNNVYGVNNKLIELEKYQPNPFYASDRSSDGGRTIDIVDEEKNALRLPPLPIGPANGADSYSVAMLRLDASNIVVPAMHSAFKPENAYIGY